MSSRIGRAPIDIPSGVEVKVSSDKVEVKGPKGVLTQVLPAGIALDSADNVVSVKPDLKIANANALSGTIRAIVNNMVEGVAKGFEIKLLLVGVGYRAAAGKQGSRHKLDLTLGLSHPVTYIAPEGIELACPSATEILVTGIDKQKVGQAAADIRGIRKGIRKPEPYKGKGIRYADEQVILKETKKK